MLLEGIKPFTENLIIFGFPIFFIGAWLIVLKIISEASGWTSLVEHFYFPEKFKGKIYKCRYIQLRNARSKAGVAKLGCTNIGYNETGLYLVPYLIFRPFFKPILIPWDKIEVTVFKEFFTTFCRCTIQDVPDINILIPKRTFDKAKNILKNH